jgi:hypothetical protein
MKPQLNSLDAQSVITRSESIPSHTQTIYRSVCFAVFEFPSIIGVVGMLNYPYAKCPVSEADTRRTLDVLLKESEKADFGGFSLFWLCTNFVKLRSIKSHPKTHLSLRIGEGFGKSPSNATPRLAGPP